MIILRWELFSRPSCVHQITEGWHLGRGGRVLHSMEVRRLCPGKTFQILCPTVRNVCFWTLVHCFNHPSYANTLLRARGKVWGTWTPQSEQWGESQLVLLTKTFQTYQIVVRHEQS